MVGRKNLESDVDSDDEEDNHKCKVIALAIVEKEVVMNSGEERSLIHYILVHDDIRFKNVGTVFLKMMMSPKQYRDRKVMCVTYLPKKYSEIIPTERNDFFFQKFSFQSKVKNATTRKETMMSTR